METNNKMRGRPKLSDEERERRAENYARPWSIRLDSEMKNTMQFHAKDSYLSISAILHAAAVYYIREVLPDKLFHYCKQTQDGRYVVFNSDEVEIYYGTQKRCESMCRNLNKAELYRAQSSES